MGLPMKKIHFQSWQQCGTGCRASYGRWLSISTNLRCTQVSLVVPDALVQWDSTATAEHLADVAGFSALAPWLILRGGDWNSHIGRAAPDDVISDWCGTHGLNTPTFRYEKEIGELLMGGGCFHIDSHDSQKPVKERGTWWNPNRQRWHDNDNFICNAGPEGNRWPEGCTSQVGALDHKMKIVACCLLLGARGT